MQSETVLSLNMLMLLYYNMSTVTAHTQDSSYMVVAIFMCCCGPIFWTPLDESWTEHRLDRSDFVFPSAHSGKFPLLQLKIGQGHFRVL